MTEWEARTEKANQILDKYDRDDGEFSENATRKAFKIVHKWIADNANRRLIH